MSTSAEIKTEDEPQTESVVQIPTEDENTVKPNDTENSFAFPIGIAVCVIAVLLLTVFLFRRRVHRE